MRLSRAQSIKRRHVRVRRKVRGTQERPRLCVHKSLKHIYAQLVDDEHGVTLAAATTNRKEHKDQKKSFRNAEWAKKVGEEIGKLAQEKGVKAVVFDRGGYQYHGVVKAFADGARAAGLDF